MDQEWIASVLPSETVLDKVLGTDPAAALLDLSRSRAPVELGFVGSGPTDDPALSREFQLARAAARKLQASSNAVLTKEEVEALHAFVHLLARPALRIVSDRIHGIPESWPKLDVGKGLAVDRSHGVGRIDTALRTHTGTGWFVAENLVLTNRHVAGQLCGLNVHADPSTWLPKLPQAVATTNAKWDKTPKERPVWDPAEAPSKSSASVGTITKIRQTHSDLDMALLDVTGVADSANLALPLRAAAPASLQGHDVYLVGYPAVSPPLAVSAQVAKLLFPDASSSGLKRVSPGRLVKLAAGMPIGIDKPREEHDGSTLGGSSGSPVIDFRDHSVVALHYGGQYGTANFAVPLWLVKDDPFFTKNGIAFV
jgi:hypothetical protein